MDEMAAIQFKGYRILKCEFSLTDGVEGKDIKSYITPIEMNFKAAYDKLKDRKFVIVLETTIRQRIDKKKDWFNLKLVLKADFEYRGELDERIIEINGTAIVFPYLRAIITNITSNFGMEPIILPVLNIKKIADDSHKRLKIKSENTVTVQ